MSGGMDGRDRALQVQAEMDKVSTIQRAKMSMDDLLYRLHKSTEKWDWMQSQAGAYRETAVYKTAAMAPPQYESAIKLRNAGIHFAAQLDGYKKAGLVWNQ